MRPCRPTAGERPPSQYWGPCGRGDIDVAVSRWDRTSWDLGYLGTCEGRPVFRALIVYVSVELETGEPMATPAGIREFMGEPIDLV